MAVKSFKDLEAEMKSVLRGDIECPAKPEVRDDHPSRGLAAVLTPSNIQLMRLIRRHGPASVSALAALAGRAQSNTSRSLQDLAQFGLVELVRDGATVRPEIRVAEVGYDFERDAPKVVLLGAAAE
jgi:predicted transcriptional regulator